MKRKDSEHGAYKDRMSNIHLHSSNALQSASCTAMRPLIEAAVKHGSEGGRVRIEERAAYTIKKGVITARQQEPCTLHLEVITNTKLPGI